MTDLVPVMERSGLAEMALKQPKIAVAGWGMVSPLGFSAWETMTALLKGRTVTDRALQLPTDIDPIDMVRVLGSVSVARGTGTDPTIDLAERAAREALFMAGSGAGTTTDQPIAAYLGISKGAMHALTAAAAMYGTLSDASNPRPVRITMPSPGELGRGGLTPIPPADAAGAVAWGANEYVTTHLRRRLNLGPVLVTVAACASSLTALHQAARDLQHDPDLKQAIVITAEASLLPMFIHSYKRLGVLPPLKLERYRALPLDRCRSGFVLAELASAVVLRKVEGAWTPGAVELLDSAVATDGFDLIRPDPTMPALEFVARKLLSNHAIDALHPHATGTQDHDPAEMAVYGRVLGERKAVPVYACKGALGHGLGAAGLTSLVLACMSAKIGKLPGMPWLEQPLEAAVPFVHAARENKLLRTHAVFAAGFGGHVAGAIVRGGNPGGIRGESGGDPGVILRVAFGLVRKRGTPKNP